MIVVGLVFGALLVLAFAGSALGDEDNTAQPSALWSVVLFLAILTGIVLRKHKASEDEEF